MSVLFNPWFADADANLLALGSCVVVALLVYELVREWRKRRKRNKERTERDRSRSDHWGYL